jgi:uncharacterized protein (TIGR02145 family)
MKRIILLVLSILCILNGLQPQHIALTFTAIDSTAWVQLDSIKVMNRTRNVDTLLYWPDTTLILYYVSISESYGVNNEFGILKAYPNPVKNYANISLFIPVKDRVTLVVTDLLGRIILQSDRILDQGEHSFMFTPGSVSLCFVTAQWRNQTSTVKILHTERNSGGKELLRYIGNEETSDDLKSTEATQSFYFVVGDELLYIGYNDTLQSGMLDKPEESKDYTFHFAYDIPCPGTPTVEYEGQTYNTVQIMSQCWLKENLNVGIMIQGTEEITDNGIIEKYCYDNEPDSCAKYGGLYPWNEMMQYTAQQGESGICPPGWHIPTDEEWKVLEGAADKQFEIGADEWDNSGLRGSNAGTNLKTKSGWSVNRNGSDHFGFTGLPGGYREINGYFNNFGTNGNWWASSDNFSNSAGGRNLYYKYTEVRRHTFNKKYGFSVRCLRDE